MPAPEYEITDMGRNAMMDLQDDLGDSHPSARSGTMERNMFTTLSFFTSRGPATMGELRDSRLFPEGTNVFKLVQTAHRRRYIETDHPGMTRRRTPYQEEDPYKIDFQ